MIGALTIVLASVFYITKLYEEAVVNRKRIEFLGIVIALLAVSITIVGLYFSLESRSLASKVERMDNVVRILIDNAGSKLEGLEKELDAPP